VFKTTPFHFYLAIWEILVLGYFDIDSVCIGVGDGNRTDSDVLNSIGLFLNLLPIQFMRKPNQSFGEALKDIRYLAQKAFAHSRVPFDIILNELHVTRSASHSPLFQIFFNYRRKIRESRTFCGCLAEGELLGAGETAYDLSLDVVDVSKGETTLCLSVQKDLYEVEHADILVRSYGTLLRSFVENPATRVSWPSLYSKEDVELAVSLGRGKSTVLYSRGQ
jgi:hybrid polyketide synthase/nonribosomal peptide synthetase ACE1